MSIRERNLMVTVVGAVVLAGLGFLVYAWFWKPLQDYNRTIADLEHEVHEKTTLVNQVHLDKRRLEKYRAISLPANPDQAASDYAKYLTPVLQLCGLTVDDFQGPPPASLKPPAGQPGKKAGHVILPFSVRARGDLAAVIRTLDVLKKAPILHRVKSIALAPAEGSEGKGEKFGAGRLNLQMTIEAMIVPNAPTAQPFLSAPDLRLVALENVAALQRAPIGLALGPWLAAKAAIKKQVENEQLSRNYADIAKKDIFVGARLAPPAEEPYEAPFDMLQYIRLVHTNPTAKEAFLRNIIVKSAEIRLRAIPKSGYDTFRIMDETLEEVLLRAKVLRVDQRDVYFQVGEDIYGIHIGQSFWDATRKRLSDDLADDLELTALYDEDFAAQASAVQKKGKTGAPVVPGNKGNQKTGTKKGQKKTN